VLRYDKRSCDACSAPETADLAPILSEDLSVDAYVRDAVAAFTALADRGEVAGERIVIVGHSQGGQLVPRLLTELKTARAGVMLTPPYSAVDELLHHQGRLLIEIMNLAGKPERAVEGKQLMRAAHELQRVRLGQRSTGHILGQSVKLWRSWILASQEAPRLARRLDRPLLILGGGYDFNVAPAEIARWQQWLDGSTHRVRILPCVTHALNCVSNRDPTRIQSADIGRHIDAALVLELDGFLRAALQPDTRKAENDNKSTFATSE
jgi:dienelactone hydrolase